MGGGAGGGEGVGTTERPDLEDIPDTEGDGEATAAARKVSVLAAAGVVDARYVCWVCWKSERALIIFFVALMWKTQRAICFKSARTML